MDKLIISQDFTIEDIHKIREYNYNITKDMTPQERRDYYNKRGMEVHRQIQEMQLQEVQVLMQNTLLRQKEKICCQYSTQLQNLG